MPIFHNNLVSWYQNVSILDFTGAKADDTQSNKLRQYYGATFLRHNIARLS